jgi:16S rRNA (guanine527-N7)-methyltransferase
LENAEAQLELTQRRMEILLKYFTDFTAVQLEQFRQLEPLYNEWNAKINVISRKDIASLYEKHILHSLSIAAVFDFAPGSTIIDLGSGGGFPGIPLAIFFPQSKFILVDSIAKKLKVADAIATETGLKNITTIHSRIEEIKIKNVDFVVSRAVAPLADLWRWSKPLLRTNTPKNVSSDDGASGSTALPGLICLKGGDLASEISESRARPRIIPVFDIFPEEFFKEKYLLYLPR